MRIQILDPSIGDTWPLPAYETEGAAGIDLRATRMVDAPGSVLRIWPGEARLIGTGIAIAVPPGYAAFIYPRSGRGHRDGLVLGNGTGVIDSDYRGEIMVSACNRNQRSPIVITVGERIAQLVIQPVIRPNLSFVDALDETERGAGGFGSTGSA